MRIKTKNYLSLPTVTTNELRISALSRHYLLSILMCQAINNNITNPSSTSITLDMNRKFYLCDKYNLMILWKNRINDSYIVFILAHCFSIDLNHIKCQPNWLNDLILAYLLTVKPTEVRITQLTPILVANSDALFECNTFGSRPMPTLHWIFGGRRHDTRSHGKCWQIKYFSLLIFFRVVSHSCYNYFDDLLLSFLELITDYREWEKIFICKAKLQSIIFQ